MPIPARFTLSQRVALAVIPRAGVDAARLVGRTWRFEETAEEGVTPLVEGRGAGAEIFCFWHQCVLPCTVYFRRTGATILISRSFDGELVTRDSGIVWISRGARVEFPRGARRAAGAKAGN